jgi:hypothetical protein
MKNHRFLFNHSIFIETKKTFLFYKNLIINVLSVKRLGFSFLNSFLIGVFSLFIFSCGEEKKTENTAHSPTIYTLIFIDKTESVDIGKPFVAQKYQQALSKIIQENFRKAGDKFEGYYVHENTAKGRCLSMVCRTEVEDTEGMNVTDMEAAKTSYDLSIRKERNFVSQQALARLNEKNNGSSNQETNLTQSLSVISKAAESGLLVKVFYFSDMVESVKNGRDFHINPPKDDAEAEQWAKIDAEKMKNYSLANVDISMILPFEPTSSSKENNPTVTHYWQKLFEAMGGVNVVEL